MDDNSVDVSSLSFNEKIAALESTLPKSVQDFLQSPERDATSLRLSQKYRLHADQAAAFERAYLYMLLGVNTPEDFVQDLKEANIPPDTIRGLTNDVNEQVFKKLQQTELYGAGEQAIAPHPEVRGVQPQVPVMQVAPPQKEAAHEVAKQSVEPSEPLPYNLMRPDALAPALSQQPAPIPAQNVAATPIAAPVPTSAPQPMLRTMQTDMEAMQHPEHAPEPVLYVPSVTSVASHTTPARAFQTASIPHVMTPVASRPAIEQPIALNSQPENRSSNPPAPSPQNPVIPGNYSSDPYREPIS